MSGLMNWLVKTKKVQGVNSSNVSSGYGSSSSSFSSPPTSPSTSSVNEEETVNDNNKREKESPSTSSKNKKLTTVASVDITELPVDPQITKDFFLNDETEGMTVGKIDEWLDKAKSEAIIDVINNIPRPPFINNSVKLPVYDQKIGLFTCCDHEFGCKNVAQHWIQKHSHMKLFICGTCKEKLIRGNYLVTHIKNQHPLTPNMEEYLNKVKEENNNNEYVMELAQYLQSVKEISDSHLPKEVKIKSTRGRLIETETKPLDESQIEELHQKYENSAHLRETWYKRELPVFSNTKIDIIFDGMSKDELELIYIIQSVIVNTKEFQVTYGHGTKVYNKVYKCHETLLNATNKRIKTTLKECHSHAIQNEKEGIRILPEFAVRIAFCKIGCTPPELEGKGLGEEVKNVFRTQSKVKEMAYSLNFFSVAKTSAEAKSKMEEILEDYLKWLTQAYNNLLSQETLSD